MLHTPDELRLVVERGNNCRALLDSSTFNWVVDDLSNSYLAQLVASPVGQKGADARDYAHALHHALSELVSSLRSYADAGEAAAAYLELDGSATQDEHTNG